MFRARASLYPDSVLVMLPGMKMISLQSGSNGNCIYVETEDARLLIDAGISGVRTANRLAHHQIDIRRVDGVIISHDHTDHVAAMGALHRKFGLRIFATPTTFEHIARYKRQGRFSEVCYFTPGETLSFGKTTVETLPTPHDGVDGSAFVICGDGRRFGVLTDLGHVTSGLEAVMKTLDAVLIESNYDADMLETGPYPPKLKARIKGKGGHLSNLETAQLLSASQGRLQWACLAHLSEENNTKEAAIETSRALLPPDFPLYIADRYSVSDVVVVL